MYYREFLVMLEKTLEKMEGRVCILESKSLHSANMLGRKRLVDNFRRPEAPEADHEIDRNYILYRVCEIQGL